MNASERLGFGDSGAGYRGPVAVGGGGELRVGGGEVDPGSSIPAREASPVAIAVAGETDMGPRSWGRDLSRRFGWRRGGATDLPRLIAGSGVNPLAQVQGEV
jgi:hypothetical protein